MDIDKTNALPHELMLLDKKEKLILRDGRSGREDLQQTQDSLSVLEIKASQFSNDIWMANDLGIEEQCGKLAAARAQMIDPDRGIDENHG